ncbi:glutamine--fructose-6-phosphate transaminase (isomerizing), partial [Candidatus Peregrinibacteria bacterium]|nr:glutamine--fructose-6-phosphate transaminase (isomerizing) [Candidatus Peregrinibacteria bacterium]
AIGHSRWATHGGVTEINAHPHFNANHSLGVVHNGIIENYSEIKADLESKGYQFISQTDTESIVHLIDFHLRSMPLEKAIKQAMQEMHGRYAILVIKKDEQKIIAARRGSPLIIGIGKEEFFVASDIPAFLAYTNQVNYLDDDQMVIIDSTGPKFFDLKNNQPIQKRLITIEWQAAQAEKGDYPHFMIKEIMEQKETIRRALEQDDQEIQKIAAAIKGAFGTYLVGCGTAGKVCLAATYLFSHIAKRHVNFAVGSEFSSLQDFIKDRSLMIAVSQSGETADTLEAIHAAKSKGAKVLSVINVKGSTMDRESDFALQIKAGPEKAVASTKATTAQMAILTLLAHACIDQLEEGKKLLLDTQSQINDMLNPRYEDHIRTLADQIAKVESMYIIGKGVNYAMALESAIKLQEISYIHAEGFASGELKHGPIALISQDTPVIALISSDQTRKDVLNNCQEVKARGAYVIGVAAENDPVFDYWIKVPDAGEAQGIVNIIPIQLLAYHLGLLRKNDPDMPRNLAKSVTVK